MIPDRITFEGGILYKYVCGSQLFHLEGDNSDIDTCGIFMCSLNSLLGLSEEYISKLFDDKNNNTLYEFGRFCELLSRSNPSTFEALYAPQRLHIIRPHRCIMPLFEMRDSFVTKECLKTFVSYAKEQVNKARGLNKKIMNPVLEKKTPYDFAYVPHKQGSTKIESFLANCHIYPQYCGLVRLPNMHEMYGVYYDFGAHFEDFKMSIEDFMKDANLRSLVIQTQGISEAGLADWFCRQRRIGYRGMLLEESTQFRCSSVSKGESTICIMSFNESGFMDYCKKYKEYADWVEKRNKVRYESNLGSNYDSKNMMHCLRLIHMGTEIARGDGVILDRREAGDRELLLDVKAHKYEYEELKEIVDASLVEFEKAISECTIPESIDKRIVNSLLYEIRKEYFLAER